MILMSKYKGQHGGEKDKKNSGKALCLHPPPFSGNARKKSIFVMGGVPLPKRPKQVQLLVLIAPTAAYLRKEGKGNNLELLPKQESDTTHTPAEFTEQSQIVHLTPKR